ncbi:hypothetical protein DEU56DRAFT_787934 [Suillus clintonianus]|uniref:uncharacterized protein n=1 Tax=Suillus clintonianus TaxID=1904413 RepID=UPI001B87E27C|nr:uncharacterized protein DEU56DRAFT_787934 [Suillus clintonianus]KAG2145778.1 hypothetical protein DEU56DRAFT_787934 [Suillus clintonianus]
MPPTTGQLEESLSKLQITDSKAPSTPEQWVPSKYSSDISQYVLVRPPRAPCGYRQLFGFPITKKEIWDMGAIAFQHVQPDEILPDDRFFFMMNSLTFISLYLGLRVCTTGDGKVVGDSDNIPPQCLTPSGKVLLLVLWRDTECEATCPTPSQVRHLESKIGRLPGWWVEIPQFG